MFRLSPTRTSGTLWERRRVAHFSAAPRVLLIYGRPLTSSKCKHGSQPSVRGSDDGFPVNSFHGCTSQSRGVCGRRPRQGSKRPGRNAAVRAIFLASRLIDTHKLDHPFCALPKTLLMVFHHPLQPHPFPPGYGCSIRLHPACESQTHTRPPIAAVRVHPGRAKSAMMRTFAPCKLANTTDRGFGLFCLFVWGFVVLSLEPAENCDPCPTSSRRPQAHRGPDTLTLNTWSSFLQGLCFAGSPRREQACPSWLMLSLPYLDPPVSPYPYTGFQTLTARIDLPQGSALAAVHCQHRRPECQELRPAPTIPLTRMSGGVADELPKSPTLDGEKVLMLFLSHCPGPPPKLTCA